ncbi:amino acid transporter [Raphidocelis subcapitata]|uniref:Amino acid transporter n=1 Tax=Raphidocelis subcapitata TaxID=307507 RepID=A0A2V0NSD0_9CHLO|nr:amino acid transporter [Raphidocelis subcapitata]|eukprot:GBF90578.1 amino acid transporter [Raphidocelis subcapitata]
MASILAFDVPATRREAAASFLACAFNLCKAIVGAGMMGLPRAYRLLGSVLGTGLIALVGVLTYWSMAVMVAGTEAHRGTATTYRGLARAACGRRVAALVQVAVLLFCFGFCVVYLVVITDVLTGSPPLCNGLICQLTGVAGGPFVARRFVLLCLSGGVAAPLLLLKSIGHLTVFNYLGVAAALALASITAALGAAAVALGRAHPLPVAPQWAALGGEGAAGAAHIATTVSVLLACYVGHQNLHPLLPLLKPYTGARIRGVLALALVVAAAVFTTLCVGGALAFGASLEINVLSNLSIEEMAPLLGQRPAVAASLLVQIGYCISLLASLLLYMHPLRTSVAEMIWAEEEGAAPPPTAASHGHGGEGAAPAAGAAATAAAAEVGGGIEGGAGGGGAAEVRGAARAAAMEARHYYVLTYGLLALATLAAISVPDIWSALSWIGNLCASVEAFIVPGLIALALRGLWPGAPKPAGADGGGGGGAAVSEGAPLLLAAEGGSSPAFWSDGQPRAAGGVGLPAARRGAWRRLRAAAGGAAGSAGAAADVVTAGLAVALGCGLVFNGFAQPFIA